MKPDSTYIAARIVGPMLVVAGILLITQPHRMITAMGGFLLSDALLILAAFVALSLGLTLLVFHSRIDSITAIIVTAIGAIVTLKGILLLLVPEFIHQAADIVIRMPNILPIAGCLWALLGVWLSYTGYIAGTLRVETSPR